MKHPLLLLVLLAAHLQATNYTVKASGGGAFATIQACASTASAGDTCTIFAGTYNETVTPAHSGSAGNPITFTANTGDRVTVNNFGLEGRSYIILSYLTFTATNTGDGGTSSNIVTHCHSTATLFRINDNLGSNGSDNVFSYNVIDLSGHADNAMGFYVYGDRNRFEYNEIKNGEGDCHDLGGTNLVVRGEYCHDINGASGEHIDFVQEQGGGTVPVMSFSLFEDNVMQHCYNDGGNCHFIIIRTGGAPAADTNIVRYNYEQNADGSGAVFGGVGDNVPNSSFYNNTIATEAITLDGGDCASDQNAPNLYSVNNICYNVEANGLYPVGGVYMNGNLAYTTGYVGNWDSPYSSEATYIALANKNPLFANYPTDGTLQSASPAIGAGVALTTTVGSGTTSTSLVLNNAHLFQPGWAGTNGDCIRVGASTTTCITGVDYSNNTLTISPAISWSIGAPVYLYKNSSGTVRLFGATPDVGAFPYQGSGAILPPTGLSAIAH